MAEPDEASVLRALQAVLDPVSGRPLPASGRIESLVVRGGLVHLALLTGREEQPAMERVASAAEAAVRAVRGVVNATVLLTAHRAAAATPAPAHAPFRLGGTIPEGKLLPDVRRIVAVASGKGGVGKSTTAVNLAIGLARRGLSVGLLDADIHGPSVHRMLGSSAHPETREKGFVPIEAWGIRAMSMGFLLEERTPVVWRGPMVMGALVQLIGQVEWGPLDVMVVDMPPGTGDAQLTLAQKVSLAGAVIVSTPQDIALLDARRGAAMFGKVNVPVLGIVENMSFFCCPNCGERTELFGHGGARREAEALGVPFLAEIPLLLDIRTSSDAGTPIMASAPDSDAGRAYSGLAERVAASLRL
nr:Mrp/NBP35 family ATP-binding protein [uncultured Lichenicoccus sp.]